MLMQRRPGGVDVVEIGFDRIIPGPAGLGVVGVAVVDDDRAGDVRGVGGEGIGVAAGDMAEGDGGVIGMPEEAVILDVLGDAPVAVGIAPDFQPAVVAVLGPGCSAGIDPRGAGPGFDARAGRLCCGRAIGNTLNEIDGSNSGGLIRAPAGTDQCGNPDQSSGKTE